MLAFLCFWLDNKLKLVMFQVACLLAFDRSGGLVELVSLIGFVGLEFQVACLLPLD